MEGTIVVKFTLDETGWPHVVGLTPEGEWDGALVEETGKKLEELRRAMLQSATISPPPQLEEGEDGND